MDASYQILSHVHERYSSAQHYHGKGHRGTLPAKVRARYWLVLDRRRIATSLANDTFKMGAPRHPYGTGRATCGLGGWESPA